MKSVAMVQAVVHISQAQGQERRVVGQLLLPSVAIEIQVRHCMPEMAKGSCKSFYPEGPRTPIIGFQGPNTLMSMVFGPQSPWTLYNSGFLWLNPGFGTLGNLAEHTMVQGSQ